MPLPAPPIYKRSFAELVARTEQLLQDYSNWQPTAEGHDAGRAMVRIFARLAELVVERLNKTPDKNFLAFLNLIGLELRPPQPARAPLTFQLATGSATDALVPAGTLVAAIPAEGETDPVIFETERELVVTRSQLVALFTREPGRDLYSDNTALASGQTGTTFPIFQGDQPIEHRLYLGQSKLFGINVGKDITFRLTPADGQAGAAWLSALEWSYWDGTTWQPLSAEPPVQSNNAWEIKLRNVPGTPVTQVGEQTSAWLRGRLITALSRGELVDVDIDMAQTNLRQDDLIPDHGFADEVGLDFDESFYPFGQTTPRLIFYLARDVIFSKPGARVSITVDVDTAQAAQPSADLELAWEYWDGMTWQELGRSAPASTSEPSTPHGFSDETQAFTRDGAIRFRCPGSWASHKVNDRPGFWLRARIDAGNYGMPSDYQPPLLRRLRLHYEWPLPRIDIIQTTIEIEREDLSPDLVFTNQLAADPTKDFFPFGEKPKISDTLYLAADEALSKPGAEITLSVELTNPADPDGLPPPAEPHNLTLVWEFWNSQQKRWAFLGESGPEPPRSSPYNFSDDTKAFVQNGQITFSCPDEVGPVDVNGELHNWVRVRIAAGSYGLEARYEPVLDGETGRPIPDPNTGQPIYQLVPASFRPPSIRSIRLGYDYTSPLTDLDQTLLENDFVFVNRSEAARSAGLLFNPFVPTSDEQPTLYLGFQRSGADIGFANRSTVLYASIAEVLYGGLSDRDRVVTEQASVIWEYWNGSHWARLGARDETENFTQRSLITFIGPPDFNRSTEFGQQAFWLRARWIGGEYVAPPRLRRILTNTMWGGQTQTIKNEILGSGNGEPNQLFRTSTAPVLPGQQIEVREPELPSAAERIMVEAEEGEQAITTVLDASDRPVEIWVRWHQVPDFYESGSRSRHYTLDRLAGEIRFGDGQHGLAPPQGRSNVRAIRYQTGGGDQGNRAPQTITQLKSTVPYVGSVTNFEAAGGGSAQETLEAVKSRGPKTLRHRDRTVAIADFEDLAFEASPDVARAKGIAAQSSQDAGRVGLIIVPHSAETRPIPSLELLDRVQDYLEARLTPTVDLWVAGPDWLRVTVTAEIVPVSLEKATDVQTAVLARLATFLHPLTGGLAETGWAFGRKPYRSDFYALLEDTRGVSHIRRLVVTEAGDVRADRFLVYSGDHQITMVGQTMN